MVTGTSLDPKLNDDVDDVASPRCGRVPEGRGPRAREERKRGASPNLVAESSDSYIIDPVVPPYAEDSRLRSARVDPEDEEERGEEVLCVWSRRAELVRKDVDASAGEGGSGVEGAGDRAECRSVRRWAMASSASEGSSSEPPEYGFPSPPPARGDGEGGSNTLAS